MVRPCKMRRIRGKPNSSYFKPAGIPKSELDEIILSHAEFESLRLKDVEDFDQKEAADKMEISQPTFHRLISIARKKVAEAIVKGKAIKIEEN
jgi:predicted DNA-binding protein (UPF0251 family)